MQSAVSGDSGAAFCISYGISGLSFPVVSIFRSISGARGSCFAIFLHSHPSAPCFLPPYSDCNRISGVVYFWHTTDIQGSKDTDKQNPHTKWAKGSSIPPGNPLRQSSRTKKGPNRIPKTRDTGFPPKERENPDAKVKNAKGFSPLSTIAHPRPQTRQSRKISSENGSLLLSSSRIYIPQSLPVEGWILKKPLPPRRRLDTEETASSP